MQLVTKIKLFRSRFTICYFSEEVFVLPNEQYYKLLGVKTGDCCDIRIDNDGIKAALKVTANAMFLQPFIRECVNSDVYRANVLAHMNKLSGCPANGVVFLKLILEPPDLEVIDYAWNDRMLRLVWTRVEIENAFSWLSTLGGAYSALGDYFEHCAEEAGRISIRQYKLSKMLGDDGLAARSRLYSALAFSQKGNLKISRHIVRNVHAFGIATHDKRLVRMCQGVWAKLKYLRALRNNSLSQVGKGDDGSSNGKVIN